MKLKSITYISFALNKISICSQFTLPCPWIKLFVYCRSIVAFRHGHNFNFNCSDIYIVVALTPISEEIKFDEKEISKCQWMPIEVTIRFLIKNIQMIKKTKYDYLTMLKEYATSPLVHDTNRYFAEKFMECNKTGTFIGIKEIQLKLANFTLDQKIYGIDNNKQ